MEKEKYLNKRIKTQIKRAYWVIVGTLVEKNDIMMIIIDKGDEDNDGDKDEEDKDDEDKDDKNKDDKDIYDKDIL